MRQLKRLSNPYRAVFRSYWQRPLFWVLGAAFLAYCIRGFGFFLLLSFVKPGNALFVFWDVTRDFADILYHLALPIVFAVAFMSHFREAFGGPAHTLVPNYRQPHLRIAALIFFLTALAIPFAPVCVEFVNDLPNLWRFPKAHFSITGYMDFGPQFLSGFLVTLTLMTIAAWFASFISSWISVVLAPIIFVAMLATRFYPWGMYAQLFHELSRTPGFPMPLGFWIVFTLAIGVPVLFNVIALPALWWRMQRIATRGMKERTPSSRSLSAESIAPILRREKLATRWSSVRHRRSAGITLAAPWIVGLLLAAVLMLVPPLLYDHANPATQLRISLILVTILPEVAVAMMWVERWPHMAAESLFPASRGQFVSEMTLALGIDLIYFWFAIAIATVLPLVLVPAMPVQGEALAARLLASAMMQALAFAAILWSISLRSWQAMVILLSVAMGAMAGPLTFSSKTVAMISITTLSSTSAMMAVAGLLLSALAYRRWRVSNWV